MKFDLTIRDATKDEISAIAAFLSGASLPTLIHAGTAATLPSGTTADDDNGPQNTNAPAVDNAGIPWDERIHSKNKGLNTDGTWRTKRGVDGAIKAAVEAELKLRTPQFQPPNGQPNFTPPSTHVAMPPQPQHQPQFQQQPPQPQPQHQPQFQQQPPQPQPQHQPQYAPPQLDFTGFMQQLSQQMAKRDANGQPLIHTDYLMSVCQRLTAHFGRQFNSITDINSDPNAINVAVSLINADGRWN